MNSLLLMLGFLLLTAGAELLVRGAVGLAQRLGVSSLVIGLTVVAWGTSLPELMVSVEAARVGSPGLSVGNVVGSNIANILLILGVAAVIRPLAFAPGQMGSEVALCLAATAAFAAMALTDGVLYTGEGAWMLAALAGFTGYTCRRGRPPPEPSPRPDLADIERPRSLLLSLALIAGGLAGVLIGADRLVSSAIDLARHWGISETVIGLSLIAVGTSLPELATSTVAALHREADIATGNILGSNTFNLLGILGIAALFGDIVLPERLIGPDLWILIAVSLALLPPLLLRNTLDPVTGVLFLISRF